MNRGDIIKGAFAKFVRIGAFCLVAIVIAAALFSGGLA